MGPFDSGTCAARTPFPPKLMNNENTATCYNISFCKLVILHSNDNSINTNKNQSNKNQSVLKWQLHFVYKFNCRLRPFNLNAFNSCSPILYFCNSIFQRPLSLDHYTPYLKAHKKGCVFTLFYTLLFSFITNIDQILKKSYKR